jgi:cell shape-determining protein MreC
MVVTLFLKRSFDPKLFLQSIAVPFLAIGSKIERVTDEVLLRMESRESLIEICKALVNENLTLKSQIRKDQNSRERIENLEKLLQIGGEIAYKKVYARVIKRETSAWFESVIVNKGKAHGIKENALVIAQNHVIGKVAEISNQFSTIALTSSPKFRLAVYFENFSAPMIFTGNGSGLRKNNANELGLKAFGTIKNIPIGIRKKLQIGTKIFAASLAHTDFNVPLGHIMEWHEQADGMFLQAKIDLPEITNNLQEMLIIIPDDL